MPIKSRGSTDKKKKVCRKINTPLCFVGVTGFEPATTRPPDVYSNRTELRPDCGAKVLLFFESAKFFRKISAQIAILSFFKAKSVVEGHAVDVGKLFS